MLAHIVRFELRSQARRVSTYVFFGVMFLLPFMIMSLTQGSERRVMNSPVMLTELMTEFGAFATLIAAALCGMAVVRDFEDDAYLLFFTTRLRRRDYLGGRLIGTVIVALAIFAAIPLGCWLATLMPWADHVHVAPATLWTYFQPYVLFAATGAVATGALFFAVGALTRSLMVVYLQGVVFLAIYLGVGALLPDNLDGYWPALMDPFGIGTVAEATKYWSPVEVNTRFVPLSGVVLWNRLLWIGVGVAAAAAAFAFFPFSAEALVRRRARRVDVPGPERVAVSAPRPAVRRRFDGRGVLSQFLSLTRLRIRTITTDRTFAALFAANLILHIVETWGAPRVADSPVYPVTYLMARIEIILTLVITVIFAGELVWRERTLRYGQLHDSLPMPTWLNAASQLSALVTVQILALVSLVAISVLQQAWLGYYRFEPLVYVQIVFMHQLSLLVLWAVLALAVQTLAGHKFVGHAIVIGVFFLPNVLLDPIADRWNWTFPAELYRYGGRVSSQYSDMNQYGPFLEAVLWYRGYWLAGAIVLGFVLIRFARRGTDTTARARWRQGRWGWPARIAATLSVAAFVGLGVAIYLQARTFGRFVPKHAAREAQARYEREFKQYERLPQPRITDVDVTMDLHPRLGTFAASGTLTLVNKSQQPIPAVHLNVGLPTESWQWVRVSFDRPGTDVLDDTSLHYRIHQFDRPLAPGEAARLQFASGRDRPPIDENVAIVENGTFFSVGSWLPSIGYDRGRELTGDDDRRKHALPAREDLPPWNDAWGRSRNFFSSDADWITFRATVSTDPDQVAVAPGYLQRDWTENGRRYFRYDMGRTPVHNFVTFVSGRYAVHRDRWNGVEIVIYHDPKHPYNIARMVEATKAGLDYFSTNFGPFQFKEFRILEFPRYRPFAQSFPATVPFSEGTAFIGRPTADDDLDFAFYVTLHELAHQWWAHQVAGSFTAGSNILSEMMAEYSALMVTERVLGAGRLRVYMRHNLNQYLNGRRNALRGEQPLARATRDPFVFYQKGSLAMYALKDAIGEERLNGALRQFVERVRFQQPPYTTVGEFLDMLRAATPAESGHLIEDLFERITLHDNRAPSAVWRELGDGRYGVTLNVTARKLRADDMGNETEVPLDDAVDIGVFAGSGLTERTLFLEKRRVTGPETTFDIVVSERPERAGIDPYLKLVDRNPADNVVAVTRAR